MRHLLHRPSPAMVVACLALFCSLTGGALAAKTLITGKDVKDSSLTGKDIKNGSIAKADLSVKARATAGATGATGAAGAAGAAGPAGAAGTTGPQGPKGDVGPATGTAGGDLTGSYPAPHIADGAVTTGKLGPRPVAIVALSTPQAVPSNLSGDTIAFADETVDVGGMHDGAGPNPERLTAPIDGAYAITGNLCWTQNASGIRELELQIANTVGFGTNFRYPSTAVQSAEPSSDTCQSVSQLAMLSAGDWVALQPFQSSGSTLSALSSLTRQTNLSMAWVGPAS